MGPRHSKADILDGALATAFEEGLSQLTFGRVAKHLGINDRMVVYYFPTKDDLIGEVLVAMATQLQTTLGAAFNTLAIDHLELLRAAWPVVATVEADPVFALFFEANGLAVTGREPFRSQLRQLMTAWIDWAAAFIVGDDDHRRVEAETAIALIDGLLLLRQLGGADAAGRVAMRLGIVDEEIAQQGSGSRPSRARPRDLPLAHGDAP